MKKKYLQNIELIIDEKINDKLDLINFECLQVLNLQANSSAEQFSKH